MSSFEYFYGVVGNNYSPVAMMLWLLMWLPVWGGIGYILEVEKKRRYLLLYRYQKKRKWWQRVYVRTVLWTTLYFIVLFILVDIYALMKNIKFDILKSMTVLLILYAHAMAAQGLMMWGYYLFFRPTFAFSLALISEALSSFIISLGVPPKFCPFIWGMINYSNCILGKQGYSVEWTILIECIWMILILIIPSKTKRFMKYL